MSPADPKPSRLTPEHFQVPTLGPCTVASPLSLSTHVGDGLAHFVPDQTRVLYKIAGESTADFSLDLFLERAGPREHIFFDPAKTRAAVVTCGGLSPGVNNVIRSLFLGKNKEAYDNNQKLSNLLLDDLFRVEIKKAQKVCLKVVSTAAQRGIPVPAFSTALAFYDQYRSAVLPANLLQAQRDYFGAHTYERVDKPRGEFFHTNWTGRGGTTSSSTYNV